jgi:hypothetical protein
MNSRRYFFFYTPSLGVWPPNFFLYNEINGSAYYQKQHSFSIKKESIYSYSL